MAPQPIDSRSLDHDELGSILDLQAVRCRDVDVPSRWLNCKCGADPDSPMTSELITTDLRWDQVLVVPGTLGAAALAARIRARVDERGSGADRPPLGGRAALPVFPDGVPRPADGPRNHGFGQLYLDQRLRDELLVTARLFPRGYDVQLGLLEARANAPFYEAASYAVPAMDRQERRPERTETVLIGDLSAEAQEYVRASPDLAT
jgi:hypothetical protein